MRDILLMVPMGAGGNLTASFSRRVWHGPRTRAAQDGASVSSWGETLCRLREGVPCKMRLMGAVKQRKFLSALLSLVPVSTET